MRIAPSLPLTLSLCLAMTSAPAIGEDAAPGPARPAIEEIVVTAQKRAESLQDVPMSVSVLTGSAIEEQGIADAKDLELVTPGLSYSSLVGYSVIFLRGIGTDVFVPSADTGVATYLDGVYLPFAHHLAEQFSKLERIEVLKGPQGTLFGRNTTGGAINIITKRPTDELEASLDLSYGNFDTKTAKAYVSGPLLYGLSASVSAIYVETDPYHELISSSPIRSLPEEVTKGVHPKLQWRPFDELTALVAGYITRFDGVGSVINTPEDTKPLGSLLGVRPLGAYESSINEPIFLTADNDMVYAEIVWQPSFFDVKALGSYQQVVTSTLYDYDASAADIVYFDARHQFADVITSEFQILSNDDTWLSDQLKWTAGFYFFKSKGGFDPVYFGAAARTIPSLLPPELLDVIADAGLVSGVNLEIRGVVETEALAGYAQATWEPFAWVGLTLGGRYQSEDRGTTKASSSLFLDNGNILPIFQFPLDRTTKSDFSPKATLDLKPFEDTLVYVSWTRGFKSGTYNVVNITEPPDYVKPEEVTAIELGIKGTLLDGSLRYGAAAFRNETKNVQTLIVSLQSGGSVSLVNAAEATTQGVDFDLAWLLPWPLERVTLSGGGAYIDGEYDEFPNASGYDEQTGIFFGEGALTTSPGRDFSGNETVRTPEFSGNVGLDYSLDVPGGVVALGGDGYYNSGFFYDTQNTAEQPSYHLFNARLSYLYERWGLRVTGYGRNLNDATYYANKFPTDFGVNSFFAPPRTYGVRVDWQF